MLKMHEVNKRDNLAWNEESKVISLSMVIDAKKYKLMDRKVGKA